MYSNKSLYTNRDRYSSYNSFWSGTKLYDTRMHAWVETMVTPLTGTGNY